MDPIELTQRQIYIYSIVSVALSVLVGFVPLVFGFVRQQRKYAFLGFILTIVGGVFLGLLLAIPVAAIFSYLIYRSSINPPTTTADDEPPAS